MRALPIREERRKRDPEDQGNHYRTGQGEKQWWLGQSWCYTGSEKFPGSGFDGGAY